ncbi:lectin 8-like [Gastrolobium bilobum]|uniref:lectin 8-like n=1 Tax=Gastrolobium bilobum TaxID=150636 RepID=UPI002AB1949F|nr:lectin 8-like [Gastrolobium bilobum]
MAKTLLKTHNLFSALPTIILFCLLQLSNVKSDSFSFSFSSFGPEQNFDIGYLGDARPSGGVIQLTRRDGPDGITLQKHSVGRAVYIPPVRLWDKSTGKLADFETEFSFMVDSAGREIHADGLAFFMIPFDADPRIPKNSTGGFLGLFSPETAFNTNQNQILAVEFDSFGNVWDPIPVPIAPHIGIDIDSLESLRTADWPINSVPEGSIGKASISYNSNAQELTVVFGYFNTPPKKFVTLAQTIDLGGVLPEWVRIGFSGATGDDVETHDILSWSFSSRI